MDAQIFLNVMILIGGGLCGYILYKMIVVGEKYGPETSKKEPIKNLKPESMVKYVTSGINIRVKIIYEYSSPTIIIVECINNLPDENKILVKRDGYRPYILLYNSKELSDFELMNPHIKKPRIKLNVTNERTVSGERAPDLDR